MGQNIRIARWHEASFTYDEETKPYKSPKGVLLETYPETQKVRKISIYTKEADLETVALNLGLEEQAWKRECEEKATRLLRKYPNRSMRPSDKAGKMEEQMYTTKRHKASVQIDEYLDGYVNVEEFLVYCENCPNYGTFWACPPFDFAPLDYWKRFEILDLYAEEIIFDEQFAGKKFEQEAMNRIISDSLKPVKKRLTEDLYELERKTPGSISLSAGSCELCRGDCARKNQEPCKFPEKMRYSIEALGGNVGLTISKLMGIELEWIREGVLPDRFVLVCGLLKKRV